MSRRAKSRRTSHRRQLQLETLEMRSMLSLTAFAAVDVGTVDNTPVPDCGVVIVAKALPVSEAPDLTDCDGSIDMNDATDDAAQIECVVADVETDAEAIESDAYPLQYFFDTSDIDQTFDEKADYIEPVDIEMPIGNVRFALQQPDVNDCEVAADVDGGAEWDPTVRSPAVIYFSDDVAEATGHAGTETVDESGAISPVILYPAEEGTASGPTEPPTPGPWVPVIYTLAGDSTENGGNMSADSVATQSAKPETDLPVAKALRKDAHSKRADRLRANQQRHDEALIAAFDKADDHASMPTLPPVPPIKNLQSTTDGDVKPLEVARNQLTKLSHKKKSRGHKGH